MSARKVRVAFTVELDVDAWADDYGIDKSQVREDLNEYARNALLDFMDTNGYAR